MKTIFRRILGFGELCLKILFFIWLLGLLLLISVRIFKFSGGLNVDSWDPARREKYSQWLNVTIPETLEWRAFHERHSFRDVWISGEFLAEEPELEVLFPSRDFPLETILPEQASGELSDLSPTSSLEAVSASRHRFLARGNWRILTVDEASGKVHVWFRWLPGSTDVRKESEQ